MNEPMRHPKEHGLWISDDIAVLAHRIELQEELCDHRSMHVNVALAFMGVFSVLQIGLDLILLIR